MHNNATIDSRFETMLVKINEDTKTNKIILNQEVR